MMSRIVGRALTRHSSATAGASAVPTRVRRCHLGSTCGGIRFIRPPACLYLNGIGVAQMSNTLPLDLISNPLGIGRHVRGIADPFNGHIDEFRISHVQRSDGWSETTWNNMSDSGAFTVAGPEEQEGGEPPPLAGAGVVVCLMG
jgi:hypothetical protein